MELKWVLKLLGLRLKSLGLCTRLYVATNLTQDYKGFMARLSKVRVEQMGPLCTASVELGSYQRGYEYIVRYYQVS